MSVPAGVPAAAPIAVQGAGLDLPLSPEAKEMHGPAAVGGGWRRFASLTWMIGLTEFRLAYFGSALGPIWSLMRPLMLFGVLYVVFSHVVKLGNKINDYPVLLLFNIMLFGFFGEATGASVSCVLSRESLVRKMHFPRMVIPLATVLTSLLNLGVNLIAVFVFFLIYGLQPLWTWLLLPVILAPLVLLATGVAMILSSLYVRYRDVDPIWGVVSQALFYGSPIFYTLASAPHTIRHIMAFSPIATILSQARRWIVDPSAPGAIEASGGVGPVVVAGVLLVAIFFGGLWIFNREAPRIAERL